MSRTTHSATPPCYPIAARRSRFKNFARTNTMRLFSVIALSIVATTLTGCSSAFLNDSSSQAAPVTSQISAMQGHVFGGQQPIGYSNIQIWQVGTGGYGIGATPLIPAGSYFLGGSNGCVASGSQTCYPGIVTTATGGFSISTDYTCTTGTELYLTATGGQASAGTNNAALSLMLGYGPCASGNSSSTLVINEVTTIATVYALAPFMPATPNATPSTVGTSSGNQLGLTNAFNDIATLANVSTGNANASTTSVTLPTAEVYTLANVLAACVNSAGTSSSGCSGLFAAAKNADGSTPADTVSAALNIARNPGRMVSTIVGLQSPSRPFQPSLSSATDLTLSATYTGSGITAPSSVAVDANGNVWIANKGTSSANSSITKLTHNGTVLSGASGYTAGSLNLPSAIAIDLSGNVWVANSGNSTLSELSSAGANVGSSPFSGGGLATPTALAIDGTGNVWLANSGNSSVSEFSSGGSVLSGTGFTGAGISAPRGIAISPH